MLFQRLLAVARVDKDGAAHPCPIRHLDSFSMRNFTNDAVFDDTLPLADGLLEAGNYVPIARLQSAMEDWFRRKSYLAPGEGLRVTELASEQAKRTRAQLDSREQEPESR